MNLERIDHDLSVKLDKQLRDTETLAGPPALIRAVRLGLIEKSFQEARAARDEARRVL